MKLHAKKKLLPPSKKGLQMGTGLALILLVVIAYFAYSAGKGGGLTVGPGTQPTQPTQPTTTTTSAFCVQNPSVDLQAIIADANTATTTYRELSTVYVDQDSIVTSLSTVGGSSTGTTETNAVKCGSPATLWVQSNATIVGKQLLSLAPSDTQRDPITVSDSVSLTGNLSVRIFDNDNNAFMFLNPTTPAGSGVGQNTFFVLNSTGMQWDSTTNNTAKTINADDTLKVTVEAKTTLADRKAGIKTYFCVDVADETNSDDWQEPTIKFKGNTLTDVKGTFSSNDQLALTGWEYCYNLGKALEESSDKVDWEMRTGSGVNADYDPGFRFIYAGIFLDDKNPNSLIGTGSDVFFRTDTSRTEFAVEGAQRGKINIA